MAKRIPLIEPIRQRLLDLGCRPDQAALHARRLLATQTRFKADHSISLGYDSQLVREGRQKCARRPSDE